MEFESGIWREAWLNFWANRWLAIIVVGIISAISFIGELRGSKTGVGAGVVVWIPLAIAAHAKVLNGTSGFVAAGTKQFKSIFSPFLWRSVGLSFLGLIPAVIVAVSLTGRSTEMISVGVFIVGYVLFETAILAKWGTMLPACVDQGNISFNAASIRGSKVFRYIFGRLWGCNGMLLLGGSAALLVAISTAVAIIKQFGGSEDNIAISIISIALFALLFAFNLVMLATILSRGYLIAEDKAPPARAESAVAPEQDQKSAGAWREILETAWKVKWIAIGTFALFTGASIALFSDNTISYMPLVFAVASIPLTLAVLFKTLRVSSIDRKPISVAPRSVWLSFALRSIAFSIAGAVPTAIIFYLVKDQFTNLPVIGILLCSYCIFETLLLAKWGTVLPACVAGGDVSLRVAAARGTKTFWKTMWSLWLYSAIAIGATFCALFIVSIVGLMIIKIAFGANQFKPIEYFVLALTASPPIPYFIISAVISARAYQVAEITTQKSIAK